MSIDTQADNFNQDGSITLKVDGSSVKYVKESDLGAVKVQLKDKEGEVTKLQTSLASANTKADTSHQSLLQERAAKEQFETKANESDTLKTKVGELTTEVAGLKTSSGETATRLTERVRKTLTDGYKIDAEKIKDMALDKLLDTENTLILTGVKPAPANYDGKGGSGGSPADELKGKSPLALATMGYAQSKDKKE